MIKEYKRKALEKSRAFFGFFYNRGKFVSKNNGLIDEIVGSNLFDIREDGSILVLTDILYLKELKNRGRS